MKESILPDHWQYRPGTFDWNIFDSVCVHNEYQLPNPLPPKSLVLDIGAHIGSFCWACRNVQAAAVVAYEAAKENYDLLVQNVAPLATVYPRHAAVWHTGERPELRIAADLGENTGGNSVFGQSGIAVPVVPINDAIADAIRLTGYPRIRLMKLDCEGSEYPILCGADLSLVEAVCGELHDGVVWNDQTWNGTDAAKMLAQAGFEVRLKATADGFWHVWATRA